MREAAGEVETARIGDEEAWCYIECGAEVSDYDGSHEGAAGMSLARRRRTFTVLAVPATIKVKSGAAYVKRDGDYWRIVGARRERHRLAFEAELIA